MSEGLLIRSQPMPDEVMQTADEDRPSPEHEEELNEEFKAWLELKKAGQK